MDIIYSDKVQLSKLFIIPSDPQIISSDKDAKFYEYEKQTIGLFDNLEEAKEALLGYTDTDKRVFAYEIIGPEWRITKTDSINEDEYENDENIMSDDSPEFILVYDARKKLVSSYFYDEKEAGGTRIPGEIILSKGDKAFVRASIYMGENNHNILVPVVIEGKPTIDYLYNKWKNVLWEIDKKVNGENAEEPSDLRILHSLEKLKNIEKDMLVFKPLTTVKCNWDVEPSSPMDDAPRIDFFGSICYKSNH